MIARRATLALAVLLAAGCTPSAPRLTKLVISPEKPVVSRGASATFVATGVYSDGSVRDVTAEVAWTVTDRVVAEVDSSGAPGTVRGLAPGTALVTARKGWVSGSRVLTVQDATVTALELSPPEPVLPVGVAQQLRLVAVFTDSTAREVTGDALWTIDGDTVQLGAQAGVVVGTAVGTATVHASYDGVVLTVPVRVTDATIVSVDVTPGQVSMPVGTSRQLIATATLSDASNLDVTESATWRSSDSAVVFVDTLAGERGRIAGRAAGNAEISATVAGVAGHSTVSVTETKLVSVELSPPDAVVAAGFTQAFTLTGVFDDGSVVELTHAADWASSVPSVANVAAAGQLRALSPGQVTVRATVQGLSASGALTVTSAVLTTLSVSPSQPSVAEGTSRALSALGTFSDGTSVDLTEQALWVSDDPSVATVSNIPGQRGLLRGVHTGGAGVAATLAGVSGRTGVTVTPAVLVRVELGPPDVQLPVGLSEPLRATGVFSDGSTQDLTASATWSSSNAAVAEVSNAAATRGEVTAIGVGTAVVHATVGGETGAANVLVSSAQLRALSISPPTPVVPAGGVVALTATGIYTDDSQRDLTADVTWTSLDPATASVSNASGTEGQVRGVLQGTAQVEARLAGISASVPVTVTAAQLVSLEVAPASLTLAAGLTHALAAVGTYSDATVRDLTDQASWTSSDPSVADVSTLGASRGVVTARRVGTVTVRAAIGAIAGTAAITVSPAHLESIAITPSPVSMPLGTTQQLAATGTYSDGTTQDVTAQVSWSSSAEAIAWVSPSGEVRARAQGSATISAVLSGVTGTASVTATPATYVGLELSPLTGTAPVGTGLSFTATGRYSDGSAVDVTAQATWESLTPAVAAVSTAAGSAGRATALALGTATIRATLLGRSATATLTVTEAVLASVAISPSPVRIAMGTTAPLHATGMWTDGSTADVSSQVTWSVNDPSIATISNAAATRGRVLGVAGGSTTVTASLNGKTGSAPVTVTTATATAIAVTPALPTAPAGYTRVLTATGTFSDGTTQDVSDVASWTSSDAALAIVSNAAGSWGTVSALAVGTPVITASALGRSGQVTFTVTSALLTGLSVSPASSSAPLGTTPRLVATGTFSDGTTRDVSEQAAWSSAAPQVAAPSNAAGQRGQLSTLALGGAVISATLGTFTATAQVTVTAAVIASIAVTPATPSLPQGTTQQLSATATMTDGTTQDVTAQATWISADAAVASVSMSPGSVGRVQANAIGAAQVQAVVGAVAGAVSVQVTPAELVSVGVTPVTLSLPSGLSQQLFATGVYTDATTRDLTDSATWSSADAAKVAVSNAAGSRGTITGLALGTAQVTASVGSVSGQASVTVTPAVLQTLQVTPSAPSVPLGLSRQLTATGVYSDGTTSDLTTAVAWASSVPGTAAVSSASGSEGLVQALALGTATISATASGISGSTVLTVTPAVLQQLQVTPANVSTPKGVGRQLTATGVYSDATTQNLTSQVTWASSNAAVVAVSNASGSEGFAAAVDVGSVTVSASLGSVTGTTPFTVTPAVLTGVSVTPAVVAATTGTVRQLGAVGVYSDGSTQSLTTQSAWSVTNGAIAFVSNATGSEGLVTMLAEGTTTVRAQFGALVGQATLVITQAQLVSVDIAPAFASTPLGFTRQFIAFGTYSNGSTQILTSQATWTSSDESIALLSNAAGTQGLMSTVDVGTVTISASYLGVTGTTTHTVTAAVLVALQVTPSSVSVAAGGTAQLAATGIFSDGSQQVLTDAVTWTSGDGAVAQVSNAAGSQGLVSAIASGTAVITATQGSVSAAVTVTVP